jgi:hypothetical protein
MNNHHRQRAGTLEGSHAAGRTPGSDFLDDQLKNPVHGAKFVLENAGIALFPDLPVQKNGYGVKVPPDRLWCHLPRCNPPFLGASEIIAWDRKRSFGPCSEALPDLLGEAAMQEKVGTVFISSLTECASRIVRPVALLEIISR